MKNKLEFIEGSSSKFWHIEQKGNTLHIAYGKTGTAGQTQRKELDSEIKAFEKYKSELNKKISAGYRDTNLEYKLVQKPGTNEEDDKWIIVFEKDTTFNYNLELDFSEGLLKHNEKTIVGIHAKKNLTINACLVNWETDYGPSLTVKGNLTADAVAIGGSHVFVGGDLRVKTEIVSSYNHGCLEVKGSLRAAVWAVESTLARVHEINALVYPGWYENPCMYTKGVKDENDPYDIKDVFAASVIKGGESLDFTEATRQLVKGKSIIKKEIISIQEKTDKKLKKKLENPEKVKTLTLSDLSAFPKEIFAFTNLRELNCTDCNFKSIPKEIGRLKELKQLDLQRCGLTELPNEIGQLEKLETLKLYQNSIYVLPDSLKNCKKLDVVSLENNPLSSVRKDFTSWEKVKFMYEFPEFLTELESLWILNLESTYVKNLPKAPFKSKKLEKVNLTNTLITQKSADPRLIIDLEKIKEKDHGSFFEFLMLKMEELEEKFPENELILGFKAFILEINLPQSSL
ncbi:MAG: WGR domain-containing protein [bacterium]|nr:WGR domain-containing protein [bacterium]